MAHPDCFAQHWSLWPVVSVQPPGHQVGAVVVDRDLPGASAADPFPLGALADDPVTALDWTAQALHQALLRLEAGDAPPWLAVPLPALALRSLRGLLRRLAQLGDSQGCADLESRLVAAGRRLVLLLPQNHRALAIDPSLLSGLASRHGLAELWHQVCPSVFQASPEPFLERVLLAPALVAGIDADLRLQRQWSFLIAGLRALQLPVVALGVQPGSELAWLGRHGCEEVGGPPLVDVLDLATGGAAADALPPGAAGFSVVGAA